MLVAPFGEHAQVDAVTVRHAFAAPAHERCQGGDVCGIGHAPGGRGRVGAGCGEARYGGRRREGVCAGGVGGCREVGDGARVDERLLGQATTEGALETREQLGALEAAEPEIAFEIGVRVHLRRAAAEFPEQRCDLLVDHAFEGCGGGVRLERVGWHGVLFPKRAHPLAPKTTGELTL